VKGWAFLGVLASVWAGGDMQTPFGPLRVSSTVLDHGSCRHQVILGDQVLIEDETYATVSLVGGYPHSAPTLFLLAVGSAGSACPMEFRVLELQPEGRFLLSDAFGTCAEQPTVAYEDGTLRVRLPSADRKGERAWIYRQGKLSEVPSGADALASRACVPGHSTEDLSDREVSTVAGRLRVESDCGGREPCPPRLMLDGQAIFEEKEFWIMEIAAALPEDKPHLVVLALVKGTSPCGVMYRVIELKKGAKPRTTRPFGTCNDLTEACYENGTLRLRFAEAEESRPRAWVYRKGRLVEEKP
jgi:hypothetical protein